MNEEPKKKKPMQPKMQTGMFPRLREIASKFTYGAKKEKERLKPPAAITGVRG